MKVVCCLKSVMAAFAIAGVSSAQEDMKVTIEQPLLGHSISMRAVSSWERTESRKLGDEATDWQLTFVIRAATTNARAFPVAVYAALLVEDSKGVRKWIDADRLDGWRIKPEYTPVEVNAASVSGTTRMTARFGQVANNVIAWKILSRSFTHDEYSPARIAAEHGWSKPGISGDIGMPSYWTGFYKDAERARQRAVELRKKAEALAAKAAK